VENYQKPSEEFKQAIIAKILNRGGRSIASICEEAGIAKSTVTSWVARCGKVTPKKTGGRTNTKWNGEAKLKAVFDTAGLAETDLGTYLRKEGLYSNQVTEWRAEIIEHFETKPKFVKDERDDIIKALEREILRKDKALAEASALLILQKKVDLIWGNRGEDGK
jgi:transposase